MPESQFTEVEERKLRNLLAKEEFWKSRLAVGKKLVDLAGGTLRLAPKSDYIAIQPHGAETRTRRNAISLLVEGISFTVPDWSVQTRVTAEGLTTERGEATKLKTMKRLRFPSLTEREVEAHIPLFTSLTIEAERAITGKQSQCQT